MKRTKEKQELEIDNDERRAMFKDEITDVMKKEG